MPTNLLKQKNPYFKNLSPDAQEIFVSRLFNFMKEKEFIGREGLVITDEIRVLISASAVQLTFGLRDYTIAHLHTINVFPHVFFSKFYNTSFKGLNTQGGVLSLSWNDFKDGYANETDKINLGLHELAHALNIDSDEEGNFDNHFSSYFEKWETIASKDYEDLKAGRITFLRSYGGTNMHEFFAVCVEHFFEASVEFKKQLPHLYNFLMLMLNQDPSNVTNDYRLTVSTEKGQSQNKEQSQSREATLKKVVMGNSGFDAQTGTAALQPSALEHFVKTKGIYIAMITTFIGLFGGIPMLIWFWYTTLISIGGILLGLFICGALGLAQWNYVKNHLDMEYHQFSMYAFTGFGMCLINLIFGLNQLIHIHTYTRTYNVASFANDSEGLKIELVGDGHNKTLERSVSSFIFDHFDRIPVAEKITVTFDTGIFGLDMIEACVLN